MARRASALTRPAPFLSTELQNRNPTDEVGTTRCCHQAESDARIGSKTCRMRRSRGVFQWATITVDSTVDSRGRTPPVSPPVDSRRRPGSLPKETAVEARHTTMGIGLRREEEPEHTREERSRRNAPGGGLRRRRKEDPAVRLRSGSRRSSSKVALALPEPRANHWKALRGRAPRTPFRSAPEGVLPKEDARDSARGLQPGDSRKNLPAVNPAQCRSVESSRWRHPKGRLRGRPTPARSGPE